MNYKWLLIFLAFSIQIACSTNTAHRTTKAPPIQLIKNIAPGYFHPQWMPDGKHLLVTGVENRGLYLIDIQNESTRTLTKDRKAGNNIAISDDGQHLAYQGSELTQRRRMHAIHLLDLDGNKKTIYKGRPPCKVLQFAKGKLYYLADNTLHAYDLESGQDEMHPDITLGYSDSDLHLVWYSEKEAHIIDPLEKGKYIWASMSPAEPLLVFNRAGLGTHVCDASGKLLADLGRLHATQWTPDGQWLIGMDDYDNGMAYTASDIIRVSKAGRQRTNLTEHSSVIALYPRLSPDGTRIAFSSPEGWMYLMPVPPITKD